MEKTKFILFLLSLFLTIDLYSCDYPAYLPRCPQNYFINMTYKCVSCPEDQVLNLQGNCECKNPYDFFNITDKKCYSCPPDSTEASNVTDKEHRCICNKDANRTEFDATNWQCTSPKEFCIYYPEYNGPSGNFVSTLCSANQYYYITRPRQNLHTGSGVVYYDHERNLVVEVESGYCYECPEGTKQDPDDIHKCKCPDGEIFDYYLYSSYYYSINTSTVCHKECVEGESFSFYYEKCIKCGTGSSFDANSSLPCLCPEGEYFNKVTFNCMKIPANSEKQKDGSNVRCLDSNSYLNETLNECKKCGEDAFPYKTYNCLCKDLAKEYDYENEKCVACEKFKVRSSLTSSLCNSCTGNHFYHYYEEKDEEGNMTLKWTCKECPETRTSDGCTCKKPFQEFDTYTEKCFECGKGAHKSEKSLDCVCDKDDEFYDKELRKCRKCPEGSLPSSLPFLYVSSGSRMMTCVCPPNQIYDRKNNKCLDECTEGQTFDYQCSPCPGTATSNGNTTNCNCGTGKYWDIKTQTCKLLGTMSSSSYLKLCFGLLLLILLL